MAGREESEEKSRPEEPVVASKPVASPAPAAHKKSAAPRPVRRLPKRLKAPRRSEDQNTSEPCIQAKIISPAPCKEPAVQSPQPKRLLLEAPLPKKKEAEKKKEPEKEKSLLPEIKRRAPAAKRRVPRVHAVRRDEEALVRQHYLQAAGCPSQYYSQLSPGNSYELGHRLKQIYEEPDQQLSYKQSPYANYAVVVPKGYYGNGYEMYPQPALAKPSWWG